jgi:2,5-diketo-D-gluconate reductase A
MPMLTLRNGVEIPIMSAGTWQYRVEEAQNTVEAALAAGFSHIDTAYDYNNQQGVAKGLQNAMASGRTRESIFLTTKVPGCGLQNVSAVSVEKCKSDTAARIEDDLKLLGLNYIDLLLLHFPPCPGANGSAEHPTPDLKCVAEKTGCTEARSCDMIKAQWSSVLGAYDKKQLRAVGVSNYCSACLKCLDGATVSPMVNQVHYQVGMGPNPQGAKTLADERGIVLQAWSPLGMGGNGSRPIMNGTLTTSIAKKYGKSPVQVALKWIVSQNVSVATKSSNPVHLKENLDIFDFEFRAEDKLALDQADFAAKDEISFLCSDETPSSTPGTLDLLV